MAKKKAAAPKRKKQVVEENEVEEDVDVPNELPEKRNEASDKEDSEEEQPKSKSKGKAKAKPASKKRGGKSRPTEVEEDEDEEEEIEKPKSQSSSKKSKGKGRKANKTSDDEDEEVENGDAGNESQSSSKKGRGRPKKASDVSSDIGEEEADDEDQSPVKKGRGRPKKGGDASPDIFEDEENEEDQSPVKKGKGRPSKKAEKRKSTGSSKQAKKAKRGPSSSKQPASDDDDEEEEKEYEVDRILDVTILKNGQREFLIKWKGYSKEDSTWEPESHLDCKELLENFMAKLEDDHLSRPRRLSRRPSTMSATRISETRQIDLLNRVKEGRIDKYTRRSSVSSTRSLGKVQNNRFTINGGTLNSVSENVIIRPKKRQSSLKGLLRATLLSCTVAATLGGALFYTTPSLSWDDVTLQTQALISGFKDKLGHYYQSTNSLN